MVRASLVLRTRVNRAIQVIVLALVSSLAELHRRLGRRIDRDLDLLDELELHEMGAS